MARTIGAMTALLIVLASVVAVAAAIRSTWSPCGLSMLSTITPIGERGRNHRYASTAAWFILGATLGGATLGLGAAVLAAGVGALDLSPEAALGATAVFAAVTIASDLNLGGFRLPSHTRQVNESWLDEFRSWVYGGGFGWQIGVGLATYVTTAAVYLMIAMAALTGDPLVAFLLDDRVRPRARPRRAARAPPHHAGAPASPSTAGSRSCCPPRSGRSSSCRRRCSPIAAGAAWGPAPAVVLGAAGLVVAARRPAGPRPADPAPR